MGPEPPPVSSDDPWDNTLEGRAYWQEAIAIEEWIEAGEPSPLDLWLAPSDPPAAPAPVDLSNRQLLSREEAARVCGGVSDETFDRHVRPKLHTRMIGSRPYFSAASVKDYCAGYKPL